MNPSQKREESPPLRALVAFGWGPNGQGRASQPAAVRCRDAGADTKRRREFAPAPPRVCLSFTAATQGSSSARRCR
jgi:hypothetical protein